MQAAERKPGLTWGGIQHAVQKLAIERGHYHGYPLPVEGYSLDVVKSFPLQGVGNYIPRKDETEKQFTCSKDDISEGEVVRNEFYSRQKQGWAFIVWHDCETVSPTVGKPYLRPGRVECVVDRTPPYIHRFNSVFSLLDIGRYWVADAECVALERLRELIGEDRFNQYVLTGMFLEHSDRSGMVYLFRRCRPTVAMRMEAQVVRITAALCMHPIGYYRKTFAGAMVPTDDVIAHLLLMRGDEHRFWKWSSQHRPWHAEAGI